MSRKRRKHPPYPNRNAAKWRLAGFQASFEEFRSTFGRLLSAREHAEIIATQEHLEYMLQTWDGD